MRTKESNIVDLTEDISPQEISELYEGAKVLVALYDSGRKTFRMGNREDLKDLMARVRRVIPYGPC